MHKEAATILTDNLDGFALYSATGDSRVSGVVSDLILIDYLYGIVDINERLKDAQKTQITSDIELQSAMDKLRYFSNRFTIDYADIPAGGTGGITPPPVVPITDIVRAGNVPVVAGTNNIAFSSALDTTDYTIDAYIIFGDQSRQNNPVISTQSKSGFVVTDVLQDGTLYYQVVVNI
jgi:hypothetical protein